jgi:hydrogenase maturation protease
MSLKTELIIGYGSSLRGDDRAGLVAAEELASRGFHALAVPQLTPELASAIAEVQRVIFIDASADVAPGEVSVEPIELNPSIARPFEHHASPAAILRLAADCYGWKGEAFLIAIGCQNFDLSEDLSEPAKQGIKAAVLRI